MKLGIKYITFPTKKCVDLCKGRTCSPYKYPKYSKKTISVRKVMCTYKKIITKYCRRNDILTFMDTDLRFPKNTADYISLLIEATENSTTFFNSLSVTKGNNVGLKILRLAYGLISDNYKIIQSLLGNELEESYASDIRVNAKILKLNLVFCVNILKEKDKIGEHWVAADVVQDLQNYVNSLRTICSFIYLIILKKKSSVVHKMLPTVFSSSYACVLCGKTGSVCRCIDSAPTSVINYDEDDDYCFLPEIDENYDIENMPHCSKSAGYGEMEDDFIKSKCDSQGSSSDTD